MAHKNYHYLRIFTGILLILITGLKVSMMTYAHISKSFSVMADPTGKEEKKTAEKDNLQEKENSFFGSHTKKLLLHRWYSNVVHLTAYRNHYNTSYFPKIAIPPPDIHIQ